MAPWFVMALLALLFLGLQRFLYKVAAERDVSTALTTLTFMSGVALVSWLFYLASPQVLAPTPELLGWGIINGLSFLGSAVFSIEALKLLPASTVYTSTRLSTVLAAVFSLLYFRDPLSLRQAGGIVLALAVMLLNARRRGSAGQPVDARVRRGLLLALLALLAGTVATISSKFAAMGVDKFGFMAVSYSVSAAGSLLLRRRELGAVRQASWRPALLLGLAMAALNLVGFYALLAALAVGPLAIIAPLTGLHFVVAILLSLVVFHERLAPRELAGVVFAVLAMLLMKS